MPKTMKASDKILEILMRKKLWHSRYLKVYSRLDYIFISEDLFNRVINCKTYTAVLTDHDLVVTKLNLDSTKHGKGFWKFNASLLHDRDYVDS